MQKSDKSKKAYRRYDETFKAEAISQMRRGRSVKELSAVLGVGEGLLYRWKGQAESSGKDQNAEISLLKKRNKQLEEENAILKKALRIFSRGE